VTDLLKKAFDASRLPEEEQDALSALAQEALDERKRR